MKNKTLKDILTAIKGSEARTSAYDTPAEVVRVEDSTLWVHIPGGVDETPVQKTINAAVGDTVNVHVAGGTAWATGNSTAPPTDDREAIKASETAKTAITAADRASEDARLAQNAASSAVASANIAAAAADDALTKQTAK